MLACWSACRYIRRYLSSIMKEMKLHCSAVANTATTWNSCGSYRFYSAGDCSQSSHVTQAVMEHGTTRSYLGLACGMHLECFTVCPILACLSESSARSCCAARSSQSVICPGILGLQQEGYQAAGSTNVCCTPRSIACTHVSQDVSALALRKRKA